jgi:hypothetical protein
VIARLRAGSSGIAADSPVIRIPFEIQLQTAFEHAWCVTTHEVSYKSDRIDWRRLRLTAQLRASVEQLDLLIAGYDILADQVAIQEWPEVVAKTQIEEVFKSSIKDGHIPSELAPQSWSRFCDNLYDLLRAVTKVRKAQLQNVVPEFIESLRDAISGLNHDRFPRSISLLQFAAGTLAQANLLPATIDRYCMPVTAALLDLYPETRRLTNVFNFEIPE